MVPADIRRTLAILLLSAMMLAGACGPASVGPAPTAGDTAPPGQIQLLDEGSVDFPEYLRGKVVVLSFFSPG
ncbi:MAG: hypothetical protein R6U70_02160 [Bacillota bacterium]